MKTLDEVIKKFELCNSYSYDMCNSSCPYFDDKCACDPDALYYLLEYQEMKEHLACLDDGEIRGDDTQVVNNPPLSWDELRQMEGKAVWIDSVPLVRRWVIIKKFHPIGGNKNLFDMEVEDGGHFLRKNMRRDDPAWWQAYRKERKNETD